MHEEGLHLRVIKNGKRENIWPLSNGKFLVPIGTKTAHVIAFSSAEDQEQDDDFQATFDTRYVKSYDFILLQF